MSDFIPFEDERFGSVRVVMREGEPWFLASDVCKALGLANEAKAMRPLEDERGWEVLESYVGPPQQVNVISAPGLYFLALRSRNPKAKFFRLWVKHGVIPSLSVPGTRKVKDPSDPSAEACVRALTPAVVDLLGKKLEGRFDKIDNMLANIMANTTQYVTPITQDALKAKILALVAEKGYITGKDIYKGDKSCDPIMIVKALESLKKSEKLSKVTKYREGSQPESYWFSPEGFKDGGLAKLLK
jgi:prophage antirepressor-like protein